MDEENSNYDRNIKKTGKVVLFIAVPILVILAIIIFATTHLAINEKPSYVEILSKIDVHCYNVNWFGTNGFQITYNESIQEIGEKLAEYNYDFKQSEFFNNTDVKNYLIRKCPHIDSKLQAPKIYNPNLGINVVDKCLVVKQEMVDFQDYCAQFIK